MVYKRETSISHISSYTKQTYKTESNIKLTIRNEMEINFVKQY